MIRNAPSFFRRRLAAVSFFVFALAVLVAAPGTASERPPLDAQGLDALVAANKGRVVVVNYWATWCGPCRREFPELVKLRRSIPDSELAIIGVSLDFDRDMLDNYLTENPMPYPVHFAAPTLMDDKDIDAIPKTLVFAPDGRLVLNHEGPVTFEELRAAVLSLHLPGDKESQ